jgi:hypothetical protein
MVMLFNSLWSQFLSLLTVVHILWNVTTIITDSYFILFLNKVLFICLR